MFTGSTDSDAVYTHTWVTEGIGTGDQPILSPDDRRVVLRGPPTRPGRRRRRTMRRTAVLDLSANIPWAVRRRPLSIGASKAVFRRRRAVLGMPGPRGAV